MICTCILYIICIYIYIYAVCIYTYFTSSERLYVKVKKMQGWLGHAWTIQIVLLVGVLKGHDRGYDCGIYFPLSLLAVPIVITQIGKSNVTSVALVNSSEGRWLGIKQITRRRWDWDQLVQLLQCQGPKYTSPNGIKLLLTSIPT